MTDSPLLDLKGTLLRVSEAWCAATGRTMAALANRVVSSSQFFDRIQAGREVYVGNVQTLLLWLADPANWPDGSIPAEVARLLHGCGHNGGATPSSPDKRDDFIAQGVAA